MLNLSQNQIGKGWRSIQDGESIETFDQFFNYGESRWQIGCYFTNDKMQNRGKVPYRRPVSLVAKFTSLFLYPGKFWRCKLKLKYDKLFYTSKKY